MRDADLPPGPVIEADFTAKGGADATDDLLAGEPRPSAILYANDLMAVAGIAAAQRHGLTVPGDLSVVGYDDIELAAHLNPSLSTVRTDAYGWGRAAAEALTEPAGRRQTSRLQLTRSVFRRPRIDRPAAGYVLITHPPRRPQ